MQRPLNRKVENYIFLFLAVTIIFLVVLIFQEKKEDQREYDRFLDQFFLEVDLTLGSIDHLLSDTEEDDVMRDLLEIDKRLERINIVLESGNHFVDEEIETQPYLFMHRIKDSENENEDGTLERSQRLELEKIKRALEAIQKGSDEKNELKVNDLNEILNKASEIGS